MKQIPDHKNCLDIGCGNDLPDGENWIGLDISEDSDAEVYHNLMTGFLPFDDNQFVHIRAKNVLEHLDLDTIHKLLSEMGRVGKEDCTIEITVPHFLSDNSAAGNHKVQGFSRVSFNCFLLDHDYHTVNEKFLELEDVSYTWRDRKYVTLMRMVLGNSLAVAHIPNVAEEITFTLINQR